MENYPAGANNDPNAPWAGKDPEFSTPQGSEEPFKGVYYNGVDLAILRNTKDGSMWAFYNNEEPFVYKPYAAVSPQGEFDVTAEVIARYINDSLGHIPQGMGLADWENGQILVKLDSALSADLRDKYQDEKLRNILLALS